MKKLLFILAICVSVGTIAQQDPYALIKNPPSGGWYVFYPECPSVGKFYSDTGDIRMIVTDSFKAIAQLYNYVDVLNNEIDSLSDLVKKYDSLPIEQMFSERHVPAKPDLMPQDDFDEMLRTMPVECFFQKLSITKYGDYFVYIPGDYDKLWHWYGKWVLDSRLNGKQDKK